MLEGLKYLYVTLCCKFQFTVRKNIASLRKMYSPGDPAVETSSFEAYFSESSLLV